MKRLKPFFSEKIKSPKALRLQGIILVDDTGLELKNADYCAEIAVIACVFAACKFG